MWCMEPVPLVLSFLFLFRFSASGIFLSLQVKISQPVFQRKFLLIQRRSNGRSFGVTGLYERTRFLQERCQGFYALLCSKNVRQVYVSRDLA
ncbi:hypothetical protein ARMGADRAFT_1006188 [Armillaria gallica]|uniref:Uncharacterized protein n=1 Tax=Armillaria gallica TaxID=47427 RepID=A0A2H3EJD1_ARMGA|nr:hypothetical protein ARMGADRAFT_1006188 [Armillaria gallica]